MTVGEGITGGVHAGPSVEGVYFEPRVVGEAVVAIAFVDPPGFLQGIAFECGGCLGYVVVAVYVGEALDGHLVAEDSAYLVELMGIVGGENQGLHGWMAYI